MANVKHLISQGIGLTPGSVKFAVTDGLGISAQVIVQSKGAAPVPSRVTTWGAVVAAADGPDRNRKEVQYEFSNARKFF